MKELFICINKKNKLLFLFILILGLNIYAFMTTNLTTSMGGYDADGRYYGAMAGSKVLHESFARKAPFCYRILTPFLASILPFDILVNFRIIAFISNILSLIVLYLILKKLNFNNQLIYFGILLYAGVFWTLKFSYFSPAYTDYQTQLWLLLIIYFTISQNFILLLVALVAGVLQKESLLLYSLFSIFVFYKYRKRQVNFALLMKLISLFILPLTTIFIVKRVIVSDNSYNLLIFVGHMYQLLYIKFYLPFFHSIFSGLGLISIILIINYKRWIKFLAGKKEWIIYGMISLVYLFGGFDKSRLFLYLLPFSIILAVKSVEQLQARSSEKNFLIGAGLFLFFHFYMGGYITPLGNFSTYLAKMVPFHSGQAYLPYLKRNILIALVSFFSLYTIKQKFKDQGNK